MNDLLNMGIDPEELHPPLPPCDEPGCPNPGSVDCYLPDSDDPANYFCTIHTQKHGYCWGCGQFFGGVENAFNNEGLCDNCQHDPDFSGEYDDDYETDPDYDDYADEPY